MDSTPPPASPDSLPPTGESRSRSRRSPLGGAASRLPGTYAANYGGEDMDWRRGVGWLWTLFGLAAGLEILYAACELLVGLRDWPALRDAFRIVLSTLFFVALWLGQGWTRWLLVVTDGFFGLWLILWSATGHMAEGAESRTMGYIQSSPPLALGIVYLATAIYVAASADVIDFIRHRREEGRGAVIVPVMLGCFAYLFVVLTAQGPYLLWIGWQVGSARTAGGDLLRVMSARWNPDDIVSRSDDNLLQSWPLTDRQHTFKSLSELGALADPGHSVVHILPLGLDKTSGGFVLRFQYETGQVEFAHGHARFNFTLVRHPFGSWRLDDFAADDLQINRL